MCKYCILLKISTIYTNTDDLTSLCVCWACFSVVCINVAQTVTVMRLRFPLLVDRIMTCLISGCVWKANSFNVKCLIGLHRDLPRVDQIFQKHRWYVLPSRHNSVPFTDEVLSKSYIILSLNSRALAWWRFCPLDLTVFIVGFIFSYLSVFLILKLIKWKANKQMQVNSFLSLN